MRVIKFRAWDKDEKGMYYNVENANDMEAIYCDNNKCLAGDFSYFGELLHSKNFEVMQFTGHYDKFNTPIYEGDIVLNHWWDISKNFIGGLWVVKYGSHSVEGNDYYSNMGEGFYYDRIDDEEETYSICNLDTDSKNIQIVGNIYQSPELLERK